MKNIFKLLLISLIFTACDDVEPVIYNSDEANGSTFVSFSRTAYALPIIRDSIGSVTVTLNVSTVASFDRTYNIEVIPGEGTSSANPQTYSVPSTVTVPAGSYQGIIQINGVDNNLVDAQIKTFQLRISNFTDEDFDENLVTVNVSEVCPLEAPFLGNYVVSSGNDAIFGAALFGVNKLVTLEEGDTPYQRRFNITRLYPAFTQIPLTGNFEVVIDFGCDDVSTTFFYDSGLFCEEGQPTIAVGGLRNPATYDITNDSSFQLRITENAKLGCGTSASIQTFTFTKLP